MTEHPTADLGASASTRRRFLTGAGLAAGAAGAATLLGASPASATVPSTLVDASLSLRWADISGPTWSLDDVDLGDGGFALGTFSAFGDMAALSLRILVGEDADLGDGPWVIEATSMPSGYAPATPPNDVTPAGTPGWSGVGSAMDYSNVTQNTYLIGAGWSNFTNVGAGTLLIWDLPSVHNTFEGNVLFNYQGTTPFGATLAPGACLFSTLVYLRDLEEE